MRPVSQAFLESVRGSHQMRARARVCAPGQSGVDPDGIEIPIRAGDVRTEAAVLGGDEVKGAAVVASLDLETDGDWWPYRVSDPLAPFGNEIFVERGIAFGNGIIEWIGLGYFRIDTPSQDVVPDGPIRLACQDRMAGIKDARMLAPRQFEIGSRVGDIVNSLVHEVYPWADIIWDDFTEDATLGRSMICEEDRFEFLSELITSFGKTWRWNYRGELVISNPPDPGAPVYDVDAGAGGVLVQLSREISREGVYNAVVATGEGADTEEPARAVAVDDNPMSPTYWDGQFGKVPRFYSSPFITTDAQAATAAASILAQSLGAPYNVNFQTIANPALEVLDPIHIRYPMQGRSLSMREETHIIQSITIPLSPSQPITATTREQQLRAIGAL